jgi:hypothetical protein
MSKRHQQIEPTIKEVFEDNFFSEIKKLNLLIEKYPYVSMVTPYLP